MSLDVHLICDHCNSTIFSRNITHNLVPMAKYLGCYYALWRPEEIEVTKASQIIKTLAEALSRSDADHKALVDMNPPNGWGDADGFIDFLNAYHDACINNRNATILVSR